MRKRTKKDTLCNLVLHKTTHTVHDFPSVDPQKPARSSEQAFVDEQGGQMGTSGRFRNVGKLARNLGQAFRDLGKLARNFGQTFRDVGKLARSPGQRIRDLEKFIPNAGRTFRGLEKGNHENQQHSDSRIRLMTVSAEISRLAASGITRERGPSMTSSVTIILRRTGRQCMK